MSKSVINFTQRFDILIQLVQVGKLPSI